MTAITNDSAVGRPGTATPWYGRLYIQVLVGIALGAGILVASVSFSLLTAALADARFASRVAALVVALADEAPEALSLDWLS